MREILFRGKREDNGEWIEGDYAEPHMKYAANLFPREAGADYDEYEGIAVIHETVGQYTGLKDLSGRKIFEGDIVESRASEIQSEWKYWKVEYIDGSYIFRRDTFYRKKYKHEENLLCADQIELYGLCVVGNIHDNPELLKEGRNGKRKSGD